MAFTLANAQELSQSALKNQVIDEFRKSALIDLMPFDDTVKPNGQSLAYAYNRVTTLPTAAGRLINAEYTAQEAKTTQYVVNLQPFGGSAALDRVLINHEKQVIDLVEFQLQQKAQATIAKFHDMFINGDSGAVATDFDGLEKAVTGSSTEITPAANIDLSTSANIDSNWKVFLDYLRKLRATLDMAPTLYMMNNDCFAVFQSVMDRAGINLSSKDNYGFETMQWGNSLVMPLGDKPGTSNPVIETAAGITSIYTARLALDGCHGVTPEGTDGVNIYLPDMTTPGAVKKVEVEMVAAMALKATRAGGVLRKVKLA